MDHILELPTSMTLCVYGFRKGKRDLKEYKKIPVSQFGSKNYGLIFMR